jgi:uncharacterized SAM-binding protein YcdF (DUF218 family)
MKQAIIVPGRGINPDGTLPADPISRVKKAVELFQQDEAPIIIMSGGYSKHLVDIPQISEAQAMKTLAVSLGVPPESIIEESRSTHTLANAYFTKKLFCEPKGWRDLIIVASDEHMPRIEYVFRKMFGNEYNLTPVASERVLNDEDYAKELVHEQASMELSKNYLESVKDGDDETIKGLALSINPQDTMADPL